MPHQEENRDAAKEKKKKKKVVLQEKECRSCRVQPSESCVKRRKLCRLEEHCSECVCESKEKRRRYFSLAVRHTQSEEYLRFSLESLLSVNS